jgi:hypothetical protein
VNAWWGLTRIVILKRDCKKLFLPFLLQIMQRKASSENVSLGNIRELQYEILKAPPNKGFEKNKKYYRKKIC